MRWSPVTLVPCIRSSASPIASCSLASRRWISETIPAHWSANAALEPTRPPPPMMLTFIVYFRTEDPAAEPLGSRLRTRALSDRGHDLIRDRLHELLDLVLAVLLRRQRRDCALQGRPAAAVAGNRRGAAARSGHAALPADFAADPCDEIGAGADLRFGLGVGRR